MPARVRPDDPATHRTFALVSAAFVGGLLALATVEAFAPPDTLIYSVTYGVLLGLIVLGVPPTIFAAGYLWRIYLHDAETRRSWLLLRDALIGTALAAVAAFIGLLAGARALGYGPFGWAIPYMIVAFVLVAGVPQYMAAVYWLRRRNFPDRESE